MQSLKQVADFAEKMNYEFELHELINIFERVIQIAEEQGMQAKDLQSFDVGNDQQGKNSTAEEPHRIRIFLKTLLLKTRSNLDWMIKDDLFTSINFNDLL